MTSKLDEQWQRLYEEATKEIKEWREGHPQATFNKIEETLDRRLAQVRVQLLQDLAQMSVNTDLREQPIEARPCCPECAKPVAANGQHKRKLITSYEQTITIERSYSRCPDCGHGFFPP